MSACPCNGTGRLAVPRSSAPDAEGWRLAWFDVHPCWCAVREPLHEERVGVRFRMQLEAEAQTFEIRGDHP